MVRASKKAIAQDATIEEIELAPLEEKELDQLAEETRKCGIRGRTLKQKLAYELSRSLKSNSEPAASSGACSRRL
jgi:hypothetical protein